MYGQTKANKPPVGTGKETDMNPSPLIRRFSRNPLGRDLAVGDIHGYFSLLQGALDQLLDGIRYTALEYGWQRFGPRRLSIDEPVALPGAGG